MSSPDILGSPRKRLKLSLDTQEQQMSNDCSPAPTTNPSVSHGEAAPATKEAEVGITDYVSVETPGFRGILKKRYTDFLVHEILPNGTVVHLQNLGSAVVSKPKGNPTTAVSSEQIGTGGASSGASESNTVISPLGARIETSKSEEMRTQQPKEQAGGESTSPVSSSACWLVRRLIFRSGFCGRYRKANDISQ